MALPLIGITVVVGVAVLGAAVGVVVGAAVVGVTDVGAVVVVGTVPPAVVVGFVLIANHHTNTPQTTTKKTAPPMIRGLLLPIVYLVHSYFYTTCAGVCGNISGFFYPTCLWFFEHG